MTFVLSLTSAPCLLQLKQRQYTIMAGGVRDVAEEIRRLPVGVQSFEDLREGGFVYVDKTKYIYELGWWDDVCFEHKVQ